MNKPEVITICGSSKFKNAILGVTQRFTLQGKIVINHGFFHHQDMVPITEKQKTMLDNLMFRKIDISDRIHVVNTNGYKGSTTIAAIEYAQMKGKRITYEYEEKASDSTPGT